jgi:hypothetical protein
LGQVARQRITVLEVLAGGWRGYGLGIFQEMDWPDRKYFLKFPEKFLDNQNDLFLKKKSIHKN